MVGPGPNYFSDRKAAVRVDADDRLRLTIIYYNGKWYSSEIISAETFGYGSYTFTLASRVDQLDANAVLGLFTWDEAASANHYREIDIEFSRWGAAANEDAQFVVQPWDTPGNLHRFNAVLQSDYSTHSFRWTANSVEFTSAQGHAPSVGSVIESWTYTGAGIPPAGNVEARLNLWLFNGAPPVNGQAVEVIVERFEFAP